MSYTDYDFPHTHMYDSDLRELLHEVRDCLKRITQLETWENVHEEDYLELKALYDQVMSGNFPESIKSAFNKWMNENAANIVGNMINLVVFNITDDGYFVAYIPESWDEIQFGTTGLDDFTPLEPEYGHLTLSYEASTNAY